MTGTSPTRRRFLATVAAGATGGLAGCGYQPGGGELAWTERATDGIHFGRSSVGLWLVAGDRLFRIHNRDGRAFDRERRRWVDVEDALVTAYDSSGEVAWSGDAAEQFEGEPAVDGTGVYVPLVTGGVTALERSGTAAGERRWTSDGIGSSLELTAADGLVVTTDGDGLAVLDAESGDEHFAVEFGSLPIDRAVAGTVADDRVWLLGDGGTLSAFRPDGSDRVDRRLSTEGDWLAAAGATVVTGVDGGIRAFDGDGERFRLDVGPVRTGPVAVGERLYCVTGDALVAVDGAFGDVAWKRSLPVSRAQFVADEDGVYAYDRGTGSTDCRFVAITSDGERWWSAPAYDELHCSGTLSLVGDRLVVRDDDRLYGFRKEPGDRHTIP